MRITYIWLVVECHILRFINNIMHTGQWCISLTHSLTHSLGCGSTFRPRLLARVDINCLIGSGYFAYNPFSAGFTFSSIFRQAHLQLNTKKNCWLFLSQLSIVVMRHAVTSRYASTILASNEKNLPKNIPKFDKKYVSKKNSPRQF